MTTVTLSPRFQVVIPREVCGALGLVPGGKLCLISHAGRIELIPVPAIKTLRGLLKRIDTTVERDKSRV